MISAAFFFMYSDFACAKYEEQNVTFVAPELCMLELFSNHGLVAINESAWLLPPS